MKIFSAAQIREWDTCTIKEESISTIDLMERAATTCFEWIKKHILRSKKITIYCGTGNNGGDGLVIARLLHQHKYKVQVFVFGGKSGSEGFKVNLIRLNKLKIDPVFIKNKNDFPAEIKDQVIIDALFGTGLNRPLTDNAAQLVHHINTQKNNTVLSIDLPSGMLADGATETGPVVQATHTLTFETNKFAFFLSSNLAFAGNIHLLSIGLSKNYYNNTQTVFETIDQQLINSIYKPRTPISHKYSFGHAMLYAGSSNMMGAAILCAKACIRSGAGLVTVAVKPCCESVMHTSVPEVITSSEKTTAISWQKKSAIAFGPGMEKSARNQRLLKTIVTGWEGPLVIDATGLSLLKPLLNLLPQRASHPAVITPHAGELEKLFGKTIAEMATINLVVEKARILNCYIVFKGHHTLIACPDGCHYFNTTGNAGMATAGTGDTLTGILCGLLAQGYTEKEACLFAVYLHGLAGDIAAKKLSEEAMIASDLINNLGNAFIQIKNAGN